MRTISSLAFHGIALLAAALVAACGSSSADIAGDGSGKDAGRGPDTGNSGFDATSRGTDGSTKKDVGGDLADGSSSDDGESINDGATSPEGETTNEDGGVPIDLGAAGKYVILAETGISTVSPSTITGDLGLSPAAASYVTGFSLIADSTNVFSTSSQVTGKVYAADYATPTPSDLTTAIGDMGTAFTTAAGRAPGVTNLGAGSIGGMTLHAGVYRWGTGLLMATDVTLTGSASDVWVFEIAKNLTVSNGTQLHLAGGALPRNIFWQVSGDVTLGTTVQFDGTILCQTGIALKTGATLTGRLLAQTAVTLDANTIVASP
jgi:hypothetical protein